MSDYIIAYDVGTTGIKTCLYEIADTFQLLASSMESYPLYILEHGGAEQEPEDLWKAMCHTTAEILEISRVRKEQILGLSFCSQMQGLILVDRDGTPVRRAMSYMDQRAEAEMEQGIRRGVRIAGLNAGKLARSLYYTGAVAASTKDPVWKYRWVRSHEPELFDKVHKWLDIKEYLLFRCTGSFVTTRDSAFGTMLYDIRKNKNCFSRAMCDQFGVSMEHLPELIDSTQKAGLLHAQAAEELGLPMNTPVFGGGGDASLIGVGAGAVKPGQTHIYFGTSGWVSTVVSERVVDLHSMIASIVGADPDTYNYFAELETAGKCFEWVKNHLALDEINVYLEKICVTDSVETVYRDLYDFLMEEIRAVPAGSRGVLFTPWLYGNRCPFEDANARGMFFNIGLETGKRDMLHAVIEGICYHLRWQLEEQKRKVHTSDPIRFVGGGALAPLTCQLFADILNCTIETVESPQNAGAMGAAVVAAVGLGRFHNIQEAAEKIRPCAVYHPDPKNREVHDKNYRVFHSLYQHNRKAFAQLNTAERLKLNKRETKKRGHL